MLYILVSAGAVVILLVYPALVVSGRIAEHDERTLGIRRS